MTPRCPYFEPPDIPEGMTLGDYRRSRAGPPRRPGRLRRALMRARLLRRPPAH